MPIRMENVLLENMNFVWINQGNVQATNCIFNNCDHIYLDFHETNSFNNCKNLDFFCSEKRSPSLSDNIINSDKLKINNIKRVNFELRGSIGKNVIFENIDFLNARPTFDLYGGDRPETGEIKIKFNNVKIKDFGGLEIDGVGSNRTKNINVELINSIIIANSEVTVSFSDAPIYISSIDYRYLKEINFIADSNSYIGNLSDQQYLLQIKQGYWGGEEPGELPIINFVSGNYICMGATSLKNSIKNEGNLRFFSNPKPIVVFYGKKYPIFPLRNIYNVCHPKKLKTQIWQSGLSFVKTKGKWEAMFDETLSPDGTKSIFCNLNTQRYPEIPMMWRFTYGSWDIGRADGLTSPTFNYPGQSTVTLKFYTEKQGKVKATLRYGGYMTTSERLGITLSNSEEVPSIRGELSADKIMYWSGTIDENSVQIEKDLPEGVNYVHITLRTDNPNGINYNTTYIYLRSLGLEGFLDFKNNSENEELGNFVFNPNADWNLENTWLKMNGYWNGNKQIHTR